MAKSSQLNPFEEQIREMRGQGLSYRTIADKINQQHGLNVSYNAIFSFLKHRNSPTPGLFYQGLPADIQQALIQQFRTLWTYDSTGIEGNTLTLGETSKVLELGLTIQGKSLQEHQEVYGHASAIELMDTLLEKQKLTIDDLFDLHRCVMHQSPLDALRPVGDWKRDFNGTTGVRDGKPVYMEYAAPADVPSLMSRWIKEFNRKLSSAGTTRKAVNVYAWTHLTFVRIHPFFDGNGRVARLIANLPLLKNGFPPLLVSRERRAEYIDFLWNYQNEVGVIQRNQPLLPPSTNVAAFKKFLHEEWKTSIELVETARQQADKRKT